MELLRAGISVATVGTSGGIVTSTSSDENNRDTVIGLSDGVGDGNISSDICGRYLTRHFRHNCGLDFIKT